MPKHVVAAAAAAALSLSPALPRESAARESAARESLPRESAARRAPVGILLAVGDIALCRRDAAGAIVDRGVAEQTAAVVRSEIAAAARAGLPLRILVLGDLAYVDGKAADFACFTASWGAFRDRLLPVPGNHEYENPEPAGPAHYPRPYYFTYFRHDPRVAENGPRTGYYALRFPGRAGPWQIVGLNAYLPDAPAGRPPPRASRQGQERWLARRLRGRAAPCLLAFWHPPVFSSGYHGHANSRAADAPLCRPGDPRPACGEMRTMAEPYRMLHARGASLVLAGHDHHFEQFARMNPAGEPDPAGPRSFIVGTGGIPLSQVPYAQRWPTSEAYGDATHGLLRLELFADGYAWRFVPVAGGREIALPPRRGAEACTARR
ncbi:hypothetical protein OPKNFCMD_5397 [Methylobacterium crusticola]|uniref:Calcineurin-like phosphoesterase domain-containing protein n=1 Tax=Methylobacterium crusticola TaxID=1697972 RepID=A0ABQ4R5P4_9HYPH|nr:metallophosphoesterase [Methylobacterium crusticola]GJD52631.1 hypothetical protein OPKNFCMD_5397 [Methylobacterium crusticola]